jgi:hypothetical protein
MSGIEYLDHNIGSMFCAIRREFNEINHHNVDYMLNHAHNIAHINDFSLYIYNSE